MEWLMPASVDAVQGWILYAFQHGVKSLSMDLRLPDLPNLGDIYFYYDEGKQGEVGRRQEGVGGAPAPYLCQTLGYPLNVWAGLTPRARARKRQWCFVKWL